ncbi:MAG: hypothetical protein ACLT3C_01355 [Peptococcus niger]
MKKRWMPCIVMLCLLALWPGLGSAAPVTDKAGDMLSQMNQEEMVLRDVSIFNGTVTNQRYFSKQIRLVPKNGTYVNFWIKNTGTSAITINIDNQVYRTLAPGAQGHISKSVLVDKYYDFNAYPAHGGVINMQCIIKQKS